MELKHYFQEHRGLGVLSTADAQGRVNSAVYSRPHVLDENRVAFVMAKHRSLLNIQENGQAAFLFVEEGGKYQGKRLALTLERIETDKALIDEFRKARGTEIYERYREVDASLAFFTVTEVRPLIGR